jgi:hypothetical protein
MGEYWTMRPEDVRKSVNSRLGLQKERSRRMLAAKRSLEQVGIVEWVRYIFGARVWSL